MVRATVKVNAGWYKAREEERTSFLKKRSKKLFLLRLHPPTVLA
jgi:hypothetical protein